MAYLLESLCKEKAGNTCAYDEDFGAYGRELVVCWHFGFSETYTLTSKDIWMSREGLLFILKFTLHRSGSGNCWHSNWVYERTNERFLIAYTIDETGDGKMN